MIIERIGPENDGRLIFIAERLLLEPVQERFSRKTGNGALLRHPAIFFARLLSPGVCVSQLTTAAHGLRVWPSGLSSQTRRPGGGAGGVDGSATGIPPYTSPYRH